MPTPIPNWVPNILITLPSNLQYNDTNGNPVTSLYPYSYLVLVGQSVNNLISNYTTLSTEVTTINSEIAHLYAVTSGITAPYVTPEINPQCLMSGCTLQPIDQVLSELLTSYCGLNSFLGGISGLASAITTECPNLSTSKSFASPTASMGSISGWVTNPTTVANTLTNIWLTLCDARVGISNALAAVTPTCSQVIVNFAALVVSYTSGINVFFDGYTFIPSGFTDGGSTIIVTDSANNTYTQAINLVTLSTTATPLNIAITGTVLIPTSNYTITVKSILTNSTLGLTCNKTTNIAVQNNISYCPTINATPGAGSVTFTLNPYLTTSVTYRVDLYAASGGTSQQNTSFTNPSTIQTGTFSGLARTTNYTLVTTTTLTGVAPYVCSAIPFTTT